MSEKLFEFTIVQDHEIDDFADKSLKKAFGIKNYRDKHNKFNPDHPARKNFIRRRKNGKKEKGSDRCRSLY